MMIRRMASVTHRLLSFMRGSSVSICGIIIVASIVCTAKGIIRVNLPIGICSQIAKVALKLAKYLKFSMNTMIFLGLQCHVYSKVISNLIVVSKVVIFLLPLRSVSSSMISRCLMTLTQLVATSGSFSQFREWNKIDSTHFLLLILLKVMPCSTMA